MSDAARWGEGDAIPGSGVADHDRLETNQMEIDAEWACLRSDLEGRGVKFDTTTEGGPGVYKFGGITTKAMGISVFVRSFEKAFRDHFGALEGGTILVRTPLIVERSYVRGRFGFRKAAS